MTNSLRKIFRYLYYFIYGKPGKNIKINNEDYVISAYVSRGVGNVIDEIPLKLLTNMAVSMNVDTLFDVGGNIGVIAMILAKKMKAGSVIYSFEPAPLSFKYLEDTARVQKGNAKIVPVNYAVSNKKDKLYFTNDGNSCTNHIAAEQEENTVMVDAVTIDYFCKTNNVIPQVIKIDTEGAEYWALDGMRETLKNNNCYVLVEIHTAFLTANNIDSKMFGDLIDAVGYKVFDEYGADVKHEDILNCNCVILAKSALPKSIFMV